MTHICEAKPLETLYKQALRKVLRAAENKFLPLAFASPKFLEEVFDADAGAKCTHWASCIRTGRMRSQRARV